LTEDMATLEDTIARLEDLIGDGRYLEVRTEAATALKQHDNLRLQQLYALALSKSGAPDAAREYLEPIYNTHADDPETAGILGGIYKELFKKEQDTRYALLSRDTYLKNFGTTKNYYTGINAAAMSAMVMQGGKSRELARQIAESISPGTEDFWELATLGEACLLMKEKIKAIEYYLRARKTAGSDWGKVTSVYNQLWLLNHYLQVPKDLQAIFSPPNVVAFAGHMIDHPTRLTPRFPASIEEAVKQAIRGGIRSLNASIGYCSLACGGDILFAEAMEEAGAEIHVILPFAKDDFIATSLQFAGSPWINRFERLLQRFPVTWLTQERYAGMDDLFALLSKTILGAAILRANTYHDQPTLLTVQSELDMKRKAGGTRDTIRLWPFPQKRLNINPDSLYSDQREVVTEPLSADPVATHGRVNRPVLYMAFADLAAMPMQERGKMAKNAEVQLNDISTPSRDFEVTADTILALFDGEAEAINFFERLWKDSASRGEYTIKIALHAGPVYLDDDGKKLEENKEIDRIKKIAEVIPPGSICASNHFAVLLALRVNQFQLNYSGVLSQQPAGEDAIIYKVSVG